MSEKTVHTIPLRDAWKGSRLRRAQSAMRIIREYAQRHTGARNVKISEGVSRVVWARGIQNPPRRVRVEIVREDEETVTLRLEGEKEGEEE